MQSTKYKHVNATEIVQNIPLSNDTVSRRISEIAKQLRMKLCKKLSATNFSLQFDETTDIEKNEQLIGYVRYVDTEEINEELLFCRTMDTTTTGQDVYTKIDELFKEFGVPWQNCTDICTDGAPALAGKRKGCIALIKEVHSHIRWRHCALHKENLAAKKLPTELNEILAQTAKIINYIKSQGLRSRYEFLTSKKTHIHT